MFEILAMFVTLYNCDITDNYYSCERLYIQDKPSFKGEVLTPSEFFAFRARFDSQLNNLDHCELLSEEEKKLTECEGH